MKYWLYAAAVALAMGISVYAGYKVVAWLLEEEKPSIYGRRQHVDGKWHNAACMIVRYKNLRASLNFNPACTCDWQRKAVVK